MVCSGEAHAEIRSQRDVLEDGLGEYREGPAVRKAVSHSPRVGGVHGGCYKVRLPLCCDFPHTFSCPSVFHRERRQQEALAGTLCMDILACRTMSQNKQPSSSMTWSWAFCYNNGKWMNEGLKRKQRGRVRSR